METVLVMFYWGGNTVQDPEEGFSYDIPPKGFYDVPMGMPLMELESMLMSKVASSGETGRLRFTRRLPFRNWQNVIKYRPFLISDDESFSTLLQNCSIFPSCPEIYVWMEYTYGEDKMMLSPAPLMGFNAPAWSKQRKQFLTSTSPVKRLPAVEIVETNVDLLTKILLRVPAKSLIKFKCVSKRWLSFISDSQFCSNHTRRNPTPLVSGIYLSSRCLAPKQVSLNDRFLPIPVGGHLSSSLPTFSFIDGVMSGYEPRVSHSSNGLMLCCNGHNLVDNYIVCNLTTQKFIALPKPRLPSPRSFNSLESYLVFDPMRSPYYKVVLVICSYHLNACQLCIYSSKNASWKNVSITQSIDFSGGGTIWNGGIIWARYSHLEHVYSRLDVDKEKLTTTQVPPDPNLPKKMLYFGECGGNLLLVQLPSHDAKEFRVLEMDKDDFHWTVRYQVDLTSLILPGLSRCVISVISVVKGAKENDMAVVFYNRGKVFSVNLESKTMKVLCELSPGEIPSYKNETELRKWSYQLIPSLSPV